MRRLNIANFRSIFRVNFYAVYAELCKENECDFKYNLYQCTLEITPPKSSYDNIQKVIVDESNSSQI